MSYYTVFYDFRLLRYEFAVKNGDTHKFSPFSGETVTGRTKMSISEMWPIVRGGHT